MRKKHIFLAVAAFIPTFVFISCTSPSSSITSALSTPAPSSSVASISQDPLQQLSYYNNMHAARYEAYRAANPDAGNEQIVTYVNIGLDQDFYTETVTVENPDSLLVLCNKYHALPADYVPQDMVALASQYAVPGRTVTMRADAAAAFEALCAGAAQDGYTILGQSGYRSYDYQASLYNNYVARDGQAAADTYSARPGFSEHQTGLAIDVRNKTHDFTQFGLTPEFAWAQEHLHEYGFILRYLPAAQHITGYQTEEWHFRYVGVDVAQEIYALGITFDEYCAQQPELW